MSKRGSISTSYHGSLSGIAPTPESIEKLISLAEDISDKLHEMDDKINLIKQRLYWVVGGAYLLVVAICYLYLFLDKGSYGALVDIVLVGASLLSVIPSTIFFFNMRREQFKLNKEMEVEESVLNELLDMIYELDNSNTFHSYYDPVSQAAISIRLKRLKFSR